MFEELQRFDHGGKKELGEMLEMACCLHAIVLHQRIKTDILSNPPSNQQIKLLKSKSPRSISSVG